LEFAASRALGGHPDLKIRTGPCGFHLFDRRTGINVLLEDVTVQPEYWSSAPRFVSIALTNRCDLACSYCYAPKNSAFLDSRVLLPWLRDLDLNGCLGVGFGGGEPTLHPDFTHICEFVRQQTRMAVTFTTHSHRIDSRLAGALKGNVHFIRVSVDGIGMTYEAMRGRRFDSLRAHLEITRSIAPIGINFVVNATTFTDLDDAILLAMEFGAKEFLLLPQQPVQGRRGIDSQTLTSVRSWVLNYSGEVPLTISEIGSDHMPVCPLLMKEIGSHAFVHISADGVAKLSSYSADGIAIGESGILAAVHLLRRTLEEKS